MFKFIKDKINKVYTQFTTKVSSIFSNNSLDDKFLDELKILLLSADTGVKTTNYIIEQLRFKIRNQTILDMESAKNELEALLVNALSNIESITEVPQVLLLVGINGTGKTTFAAKIANKLKSEGKRVLLVAADTFRAAAVEQLQRWGDNIGIEVFVPTSSNDSSAVIFDALQKFKSENYDHIVIDTAGRLQTKINLMKELEKVARVINKALGDSSYSISSWLTVDAMLGQNSFEQAKVFKESTNLDGVVLTKFDGTGKGGIVFSIVSELKLPVLYITFGEKVEDFKVFKAEDYVLELLSK